MNRIYIIYFLVFLTMHLANAQDIIRVTDKENMPLSEVYVYAKSLIKETATTKWTDDNGLISIIIHAPYIINIQHVNYYPISDTIYFNEDHTYTLKPGVK